MRLGLTVSRAAAAVLFFLGLLWIGQGLGYIKGGLMSGQRVWFWIGIVCLVAGVALGVARRVWRRGEGWKI